jgi:hypothetical protein
MSKHVSLKGQAKTKFFPRSPKAFSGKFDLIHAKSLLFYMREGEFYADKMF